MKKTKFIFITFAILAFANKQYANSHEKAQNSMPQFLKTPFQDSTNKLPKNFVGHSIDEIIVAMNNYSQPIKKEYETSDEYKQRLQIYSKKPLLGKIFRDSVLAFAAKPTWIGYDADKSQFNLHFKPVYTGQWESGEFRIPGPLYPMGIDESSIVLKYGRPMYKRYVAQNVFGVKTVVTEKTSRSRGIIVSNIHEFGYHGTQSSCVISLKTLRKEAPRLKTHLRILFICKLDNPQLFRRVWGTDRATIDNPYEEEKSLTLAKIYMESIWI